MQVLPARLENLINDLDLHEVKNNPLPVNVLLGVPAVFASSNNKLSLVAYKLSYHFQVDPLNRASGFDSDLVGQLFDGWEQAIQIARDTYGIDVQYWISAPPPEILRKGWNDGLVSRAARNVRVFWSMWKKPYDGREGDAMSTIVITEEGYLVIIKEIEGDAPVTEEMLAGLLSGDLIKKKMAAA